MQDVFNDARPCHEGENVTAITHLIAQRQIRVLIDRLAETVCLG